MDSNLAEKSVPPATLFSNIDSAGALCWSSQHWLRLNRTEVCSNIINLILFVRTARKFDAFCINISTRCKKTIQMHSIDTECLFAIENIFGDGSRVEGDLVVINFFHLL